jgi:hypothetical protein
MVDIYFYVVKIICPSQGVTVSRSEETSLHLPLTKNGKAERAVEDTDNKIELNFTWLE